MQLWVREQQGMLLRRRDAACFWRPWWEEEITVCKHWLSYQLGSLAPVLISGLWPEWHQWGATNMWMLRCWHWDSQTPGWVSIGYKPHVTSFTNVDWVVEGLQVLRSLVFIVYSEPERERERGGETCKVVIQYFRNVICALGVSLKKCCRQHNLKITDKLCRPWGAVENKAQSAVKYMGLIAETGVFVSVGSGSWLLKREPEEAQTCCLLVFQWFLLQP